MRALGALLLSIAIVACASAPRGDWTVRTTGAEQELDQATRAWLLQSLKIGEEVDFLASMLMVYRRVEGLPNPLDLIAIKTVRPAIKSTCGASYDFIVRPASYFFQFKLTYHPRADSLVVYAIGTAAAGGSIMLGPHYRFELSGDGRKILNAMVSTPDCSIVPAAQVSPEHAIERPYAQFPTELDVLVADLQERDFVLHTATGNWRVGDQGTRWLDGQKPRPNGSLIDCLSADGFKFRTNEMSCLESGGTIID